MSKHIFEIDFDQLKFNLYDLLGVNCDCSEKKIKKAYRKLILKFHPDKKNELDDEVFNHLTLANQILSNIESRKKYDEWLKSFGQESLSHDSLKDNYNQEKNKDYHDNNLSYDQINNNLNEKNNINDFNNYNNISNDFSNKKRKIINIIKENLKNEKYFNYKFEKLKNNDNNNNELNNFDNKIIEINQVDVGNKFLSITNYNLLYSEDNIHSDDYSNLDSAFKLQPTIDFKVVDVEQKIKEYEDLLKEDNDFVV